MTDPKEILKRPYHRVAMVDLFSTGYPWFAQIDEFPGCFTEGATEQRALDRLEQVAESWIMAAQDMGQKIPDPRED